MIPLQPHVTHVMRSNFQGLGRVAFYSGSFEAAARLYMPEAQGPVSGEISGLGHPAMPVNNKSSSIEPVVTIGKWPMTFSS